MGVESHVKPRPVVAFFDRHWAYLGKAKGNFTTETRRHGEEINKCLAAGVSPAVPGRCQDSGWHEHLAGL